MLLEKVIALMVFHLENQLGICHQTNSDIMISINVDFLMAQPTFLYCTPKIASMYMKKECKKMRN